MLLRVCIEMTFHVQNNILSKIEICKLFYRICKNILTKTVSELPPGKFRDCFSFMTETQISLVASFSHARSSSVRYGAIFSYTSLW